MADRKASPPPSPETQLHGTGGGGMDVLGGELRVIEGPDRGHRVGLGPLPLRVGTAVGSHLRLTDPTVSRLHFQLHPRRDGVRLVDPGSTNGTFVEGLKVRDVDLINGATIRVGATTLRLEKASESLRIPLSQESSFGKLIGSSVEMRRLYAILARVAPAEATVLIQGETGTGKELVAREIHDRSPRAHKRLVTVDCSTLAPNLIESELFGHIRGSYTDAKDRPGLFVTADGGTVFLDEIGELPLSLQAKLLRVLENREVRPVGADAARRVDVRVIAATHRSLDQSVNAGTFREDLYYRLAVVEVSLPPLRMRREDIPALAGRFLRAVAGPSVSVPSELLSTLVARSWPGNVRELKNAIERHWALSRTEHQTSPTGPSLTEVSAASIDGVTPPSDGAASKLLAVNLEAPLKDERTRVTSAFERLYVETVLSRASGNVTRAAERAGVSRRFLQRLIADLGIRGVTIDVIDPSDEAEPA